MEQMTEAGFGNILTFNTVTQSSEAELPSGSCKWPLLGGNCKRTEGETWFSKVMLEKLLDLGFFFNYICSL